MNHVQCLEPGVPGTFDCNPERYHHRAGDPDAPTQPVAIV